MSVKNHMSIQLKLEVVKESGRTIVQLSDMHNINKLHIATIKKCLDARTGELLVYSATQCKTTYHTSHDATLDYFTNKEKDRIIAAIFGLSDVY